MAIRNKRQQCDRSGGRSRVVRASAIGIATVTTMTAFALTAARAQDCKPLEDKFDGVTVLFDAAAGKDGDFLDGPRQITPNTRFRVVIIHPNGLAREYKRSYEKVENHTAKPPDFLSKFFASSPTERSALDPFEVDRLKNGGSGAAIAFSPQKSGLPDDLLPYFREYQDAFQKLRDAALKPDPKFAGTAVKVRKALLGAMKAEWSNARIRYEATKNLATIFNDSENGLLPNKPMREDYFPLPDRILIPLTGLNTKDLEFDYCPEQLQTLAKYGGKIGVNARTETENLDNTFVCFLKASNRLALALQRYRDSRITGDAPGMPEPPDGSCGSASPPPAPKPISLKGRLDDLKEYVGTSTAILTDIEMASPVFTAKEWRRLLAFLKSRNELKQVNTARAEVQKAKNAFESAQEKPLIQKAQEALKAAQEAMKVAQENAEKKIRNDFQGAIDDKDKFVEKIQERLNEDNKIARHIVAQRQKYLGDLAASFATYAKAYGALLDTETLPTYDKGTPLERSPGDAVDITVTVTETDVAPKLAGSVDSVVPDVNIVAETPAAPPINIPAPASSGGGGDKSASKDPLTKKTVTLDVHGRWVNDFTVGPYVTDLRDRNFRTYPVSGPGGNGQFIVTEGASDSKGAGLAVFFHRYATTPRNRPALGISAGARVDKLDAFMIGGSLIFGRENRIVLTLGRLLGKTNVLNGTKVGQTIDKASPDTSRVYRGGYFLALSFALDLKIK